MSEETLILVENQVFEIVEVDPAGRFLKIKASDKPYRRLAPGSILPSLTLDLLNGEKRDLASYAKPGRYLLLDFWGSWCEPCIQAIPELKDFQGEWKDKLVVLGLHYGDVDAARRILEKKGVDWDQAVATKDLKEQFLVDGFPYYVLVGTEGKILQLDTQLYQVEIVLRSGRLGD